MPHPPPSRINRISFGYKPIEKSKLYDVFVRVSEPGYVPSFLNKETGPNKTVFTATVTGEQIEDILNEDPKVIQISAAHQDHHLK
jgi:hypothetical protein